MGFSVRDEVVTNLVGMGPGPCQQRQEAGRGAAAGGVAVLEPGTAVGKGVQRGGQRTLVACQAEPVGAQGIGPQHQDIGLRARAGVPVGGRCAPFPAGRQCNAGHCQVGGQYHHGSGPVLLRNQVNEGACCEK